MDVALALTATQKSAIIFAISGIAAPIAGYFFHRAAAACRSFGQGPFSIATEPAGPNRPGSPPAPVDPAVQAAEVRQMLEAKSERRRRRGEAPLDVEAETRRLLAAERPAHEEAMTAELRSEVRQLVVARNERRLRQGLQPLDVEAETERQLADFIGSR